MKLKNQINTKSKNIQYFVFLLLLGLGFPTVALADSGGFQLVSFLEGLVNLLNGSVARVIFVLAIIGIGYGWLYLGRVPKEKAIGGIIGIGIVFSASYIAHKIGV